MEIEKLPDNNRTSHDYNVVSKTYDTHTDKCEFWKVRYKNVVYIRESRLYHKTSVPVNYWTIENKGQNRELYAIQRKLENMFHRTIRKNKIQNIMK